MNNNPWEKISIPKANVKAKLVDRTHPIEISWAVNQTGDYLLVALFNQIKRPSIYEFPKLHGFDIFLTDQNLLVMTLKNKEQWEIFLSLCTDLIGSTRPCENHDEAMLTLIRRLKGWQIHLSSDKPKILSDEKIRGLIAELLFLDNHLFPHFALTDSVEFWTGPEGSAQDFNVKGTVVEVKSQLGEKSSSVRISSTNQLCPETPELYLHVVVLGKSDDKTSGSLNLLSLVERIRKELLDSLPSSIERFNELLLSVGFVENNEYLKKNFILLNEKTFEVKDNFPRICTKDVPIGIDQVRYNLNLANCEDYLCVLEWKKNYGK